MCWYGDAFLTKAEFAAHAIYLCSRFCRTPDSTSEVFGDLTTHTTNTALVKYVSVGFPFTIFDDTVHPRSCCGYGGGMGPLQCVGYFLTFFICVDIALGGFEPGRSEVWESSLRCRIFHSSLLGGTGVSPDLLLCIHTYLFCHLL